MKNEFIWNASKTALVNVSHIVTTSVQVPQYEQVDFAVVASLAHNGTAVLYRGTFDECQSFMGEFYYHH